MLDGFYWFNQEGPRATHMGVWTKDCRDSLWVMPTGDCWVYTTSQFVQLGRGPYGRRDYYIPLVRRPLVGG